MPNLNIVGKRVRQARLAKKPNVTQEQLAIRLQTLGWQINRFGISKIELGNRSVTDKEMMLLARALGVSISYFFSDYE